MINRVYRLKVREYIETDFEELDLRERRALVRPSYLSICAADQRYFMGARKPEVMAAKLPMALIHEGIGTILWDPTGTFPPGAPVVMLPNVPAEEELSIKENYRSKSRFLSSGYDGFMRDCVSLPPGQLIGLPEAMDFRYVFSELLSVVCNAISTYRQLDRDMGARFGIWGSGSVGYATALVLRALYPQAEITVVGRGHGKLRYFSFVDRRRLTVEDFSGAKFDCCFECVGGRGSQDAIGQMIAAVRPQGGIVLMGVSEEPVEIDTRSVLEKGLVLLGASRSGREDFETAVALIHGDRGVRDHLDRLISQTVTARELSDLIDAFHTDQMVPFKTLIEWKM